jgi:hypothetical protein
MMRIDFFLVSFVVFFDVIQGYMNQTPLKPPIPLKCLKPGLHPKSLKTLVTPILRLYSQNTLLVNIAQTQNRTEIK